MKRTIFSAWGGVILLLAVSSCERIEPIPPEATQESITNPKTTPDGLIVYTYQYYLDGQLVPEGTYTMGDTTLIFGGETIDDGDGDPTTGLMHLHAFTSRTIFHNYGDQIKVDFRLYDQMAEHLRQYAQDNGYITQYEQTGTVDQTYLDYQNQYVHQMLGSKQKAIEGRPKSHVTMIHDKPQARWNVANWFLAFGMNPWMPLGWNNRVRAFTPMPWAGVNALYDRPFFEKLLWYHWGWPFLRVRLDWPFSHVDKKASSWTHFPT